MKRLTDDLVKEIAARKTRAPEPDMAVSWRMSSLLQTFNKSTVHRQELLRYFPIAVVATIEGYFRVRLAQLIDHGEPFISNALKAYPEIKLDISMAGAITSKKVSLGGLITHSFGISSFSSLVKAVTNISGRPKFLEEVAKIRPAFIGSETKCPIISNPEDTWARLGGVFETRHILCHELASDLMLDGAEIRTLLLLTQEFTRASAIWIDKLQNPFPEKVMEERFAKATTNHKKSRASFDSAIADAKLLASQLPKSGDLHSSIVEAENALRVLLASTGKLERSSEQFHFSRFDEMEIEKAETTILDIISRRVEHAKMKMELAARWVDRDEQMSEKPKSPKTI